MPNISDERKTELTNIKLYEGKKLEIRNVHRGQGNRHHIIYACLYDVSIPNKPELLISADLEYVTEMIKHRL